MAETTNEILDGGKLREEISAFVDNAGEIFQPLDDTFLHLYSTSKKLYQSAVTGDWNEVLDICSKNEFLTLPITKSNDTVFHLAAYKNQEAILQKLLELLPQEIQILTPALRRTNKKGNTLLHIAASVGSVNMCRSIIKADTGSIINIEADITKSERIQRIINNEGESALFLAAFHGHKDAFLYLHSICSPEEGYHLCKRNKQDDQETILHRAITEEYYELSLIILHLYKDLVNLPNEKGMTPLHLLAKKPSAFKSGSRHRWLENIIYHALPKTGEFRAADIENLERPQVTYGGRHQTFGRKCADIENQEGKYQSEKCSKFKLRYYQ
ncbi:uncharacterized protein LOC142612496 [Castanea sativa]|uniref:uncharacterized protein LOC142612496 n=1 Tax=Castanea sativa TaxID=21020 RepID=UPI003F64DA87